MSTQLGGRGPYTGKRMELDKQVHNRVLENKCEPKELRDMTNENNVEGTETFLWIVFVPIGRKKHCVASGVSWAFFVPARSFCGPFGIVQPHCAFPYRKKKKQKYGSFLGISNGSEQARCSLVVLFVVCADVLSVVWLPKRRQEGEREDLPSMNQASFDHVCICGPSPFGPIHGSARCAWTNCAT